MDAKTNQIPWIIKSIRKSSNKKSFMNGSLKSGLHRMNSNTKVIKIFSNQSKRKQRKYTAVSNYLNVLEILKKHGMLWKI